MSIGTLLAFVIVCMGVWLMRRRSPDMPRPFRTPWVPFVPIMGALVSLLMMVFLPWETWVRLLIWLVIGLSVYFLYGKKHSRVQAGAPVHVHIPPGDTYTEPVTPTRKK